MHQRSAFLVKLQALNLQLCWKINSTTNIFRGKLSAYQGKLLRKEYEFWNAMYIMLRKIYCSWFSAVTAATLNWSRIDLLRNKFESFKWTAHAFKRDQWKRKGHIESTVWKFTMESIIHSIWKVYGYYNMSLLMS